jgi:hypothetical protein
VSKPKDQIRQPAQVKSGQHQAMYVTSSQQMPRVCEPKV